MTKLNVFPVEESFEDFKDKVDLFKQDLEDMRKALNYYGVGITAAFDHMPNELLRYESKANHLLTEYLEFIDELESAYREHVQPLL